MMKAGFTLIELLIVIAIIGLIAAFIVPQLVPITERARLSTSVKYFSQSYFEQQTKAQTGYQKNPTPIEEAIPFKEHTSKATNGLLFSKEKETGVRPIQRTFESNAEGALTLGAIKEKGKNILADTDSEKQIYAYLKELLLDGTPLSEFEVHFIPASNDMILLKEGRVIEGTTLHLTFANSRYPALTQSMDIDLPTSLLHSPTPL